jgi:hypothetical protein
MNSNTAGQMYALTVFTPIAADRVAQLTDVLAGLPKQPSPLARLGATHFARLVIIDNFRRESGQAADDLPTPYLLFSATFDGTLDAYLDELTQTLATEADQIWGCCVGAPQPASGPQLKAYLQHNQIRTGLFFAAYPQADVATVTDALSIRQKTIDLAVRGQGMPPDDLRRAFLEEFGP